MIGVKACQKVASAATETMSLTPSAAAGHRWTNSERRGLDARQPLLDVLFQ